MTDTSKISRRVFCLILTCLSPRRAVVYRQDAKKTVPSPKTPADVNKPCRMTRQLGRGVSQFLRCPDSTLSPMSSRISPTAKHVLQSCFQEKHTLISTSKLVN